MKKIIVFFLLVSSYCFGITYPDYSRLKNTPMVSVKSYGAVGDGVTDDTDSIKAAILANKRIFFPPGSYLVTEPIVLPVGTEIQGTYETSIIKTNTTTATVSGKTVNSVFVCNGYKIIINRLWIYGSQANDVNGIEFINCALSTFTEISFVDCKYAFYDRTAVWMCHFEKIHARACLYAFYFGNSSYDKTSLNFSNCWAENCGLAYYFNRCKYSKLTACGADYCNYKDGSNPYGDGGHGAKDTSKAVFNFENCIGITLSGCGTESCYGNGAVFVNAGQATIQDFYTYNLQSEYLPNYASYPNWAIGAITTSTERTWISIKNFYVQGFTNSVVEALSPAKNKSIVAYNFSSVAYGANTSYMVTVENAYVSGLTTIFSGNGSTNDCKNITQWESWTSPKEGVSTGGYLKYNKITISNATATKYISFPFTAQMIKNTPHYFKVTGITNVFNETASTGFSAELAFSTLNYVRTIEVIATSPRVLSATASGSYLVLELDKTYTSIALDVEINSHSSKFDPDGVFLGN